MGCSDDPTPSAGSADSGATAQNEAGTGASDAAANADAGASDAGTATTDAGTDGGTPGTGCAGLPYVGSCKSTPVGTCIDFYNWDLASAQTACPSGQGTFSTTTCDTTGYVAACKGPLAGKSGACAETWYFAPYSATAVQSACKSPKVFSTP